MAEKRHSIKSWIQRCHQPATEAVCLQILSDLRAVFLGNAARHDSIRSRLILFEQGMSQYAVDMHFQPHEMPFGQLRSAHFISVVENVSPPIISSKPDDSTLDAANISAILPKQPDSRSSNYESAISAHLEFLALGADWTAKELFTFASFDAAFALSSLYTLKPVNLRHPPLLPYDCFRHGKVISYSTGLPISIENKWLLFLHLLGWQQMPNSPLRARRFITVKNKTLEFGNIENLQDQFFSNWLTAQLGKDFDTRALHFFGSELYQDLNMASVHAIDLILSGGLNEESVDAPALSHELDQINLGHADAHKYHDTVFQILNYIFSPSLQDGAKEVETDEGRERIDIVYANRAEDGYFYDLRMQHQMKCPFIFFECKNYSSDVANTEFAQIYSRLSESRGKVGFLVCRKLSNQDKVLERCKDSFTNHGTHILVLDDDDLKALLSKKASNDMAGLWGILRTRFRRILLNQ